MGLWIAFVQRKYKFSETNETICASTLENILDLGSDSASAYSTSYKSPLVYQAWELTANTVATTEWNDWKFRSK